MRYHPIIEAYLADLDRALTGSDGREHAETMSTIREHIDARLTPDALSDEVHAVLDELGSVDTIAASATYPDQASAHQSTAPDFWEAVALLSSIGGAALLALLPFVALPLALVGLVMGGMRIRTARGNRRFAIATVAIALTTIVAALVLALSLIQAGSDTMPTPDPAQVTPSAEP